LTISVGTADVTGSRLDAGTTGSGAQPSQTAGIGQLSAGPAALSAACAAMESARGGVTPSLQSTTQPIAAPIGSAFRMASVRSATRSKSPRAIR
jgi:hypothetical protein